MEMSENCYLIHHTQGWLLWDTGIADSIAAIPNGLAPSDPRAIHWHVTKTLASQLEMLSVKPADIKYVAISHSHSDHIGNITMFPQSIVLVQKAEYDWPTPFGQKLRAIASPVNKLEGDHDVFGDGSVTLIATPGHTPGHQSLLVKLPKTGAIVLSGDAVHFQSNWDNRRVPSINTDKDKTAASMQHIADVMAKEHAKLWINHDAAQRKTLKLAPAFYD
jgi:glyoxylase-like metal-dependent hydrolase (beta-lactamase superfamily II)